MSTDALAPERRLERYAAAFADLDAPFAFVDLDALWANADELLRRAAPKPIRVASKSVRCRSLLRDILASDRRFRGLMTFTLAETLWLDAEGFADLLLAYPTTDRAGLRALAERTARDPASAPIVMVDCPAHLDRIAAATDGPIRLCLDLDASLRLPAGLPAVGPKRSPVHDPAQAVALAEEIARRPGLELVALMSYEGHIAGVGDAAPGTGRLPQNLVLRGLQRASIRELRDRRAEAVRRVREIADLRVVNAGGTGDLHLVAGEEAVTEATAGSGFYAPTLFDHYRAFTLAPAALFALPVCRRPSAATATLLGGGYVASGAAGRDRLPEPYLPTGLRLDGLEGAGEVQTPVHGDAARTLAIGDHVYLRHAKAGELCERFAELHLVQGDRIVDTVPTYRGEGRTFL